MSDPLIGEIQMFAGNFPPRNWAFCDGQLLAISANTALFSLLGTTYGGDGRTTFALPDLRGRVPIHEGQGPGLSNYLIGQRGGLENVTLNANELPSHTHTANGNTANGSTPNPQNNTWAAQPSLLQYSPPGTAAAMKSTAIENTGGSQPHNNIIPFQAVNYVIALFGIYPSRN